VDIRHHVGDCWRADIVGDDPIIPSIETSDKSNSANNVTINNIGTPSLIILVVAVGLSLGLAIGAITIMVYSDSMQRERVREIVSAAEKRAMDRAAMAEREARVALDKIQDLRVETSKR
jgi:hypothetical protein